MKTILWDFDGVILDSMKVRDKGFREIFKSFEKNKVDQFIEYHNINGGLSRYVKIRYFYEFFLKESISEDEVLKYASVFSEIMKKELINKNYLIKDSFEFIKDNHQKYNFHIVSGSDQNELRYLNTELGIAHYFKSIHGSPTPKNKLVKDLLHLHNYNTLETCLIGDSINDLEAASVNNIDFYGFNNENFKKRGINYILDYNTFNF